MGLMATDRAYQFCEKYYLETDRQPPFVGEKRVHHYGDGLIGVGLKIEAVKASSYRPVWQYVCDMEHVLLAQARYALDRLSVPARCIREMRVDSALLQPGTRKGREIAEKLSALTWAELAEQQRNPFQMEWPKCEYTGKVFRCEEIPHDSRTILDFDPPLHAATGVAPTVAQPWRDLNEDEARDVVLKRNDSLLISGFREDSLYYYTHSGP